jgi:glucose/arabinose dehydrogenase
MNRVESETALLVHYCFGSNAFVWKGVGAMKKESLLIETILLPVLLALFLAVSTSQVAAQPDGPVMLHPQLAVRQVVSGLVTPTSMAFIGSGDFLVLEKNTGQVKRVANGAIQSTVLDLAVNFGSERGLLGVGLHPNFPTNPGVYLYWTESTTGADNNALSNTLLLGNRVDRFVWDGSSLLFDRNLIQIRAFQQDAGQPERGNHNGGVIKFGPDGKLYIIIGDVGRRGHLQNLPCGPTPTCPGPTVTDDQFGGPEPDNVHLTGVILRLNDDGTAPTDNPFFSAGAAIGGEVGANVQKIFSYGHRNSFGLDFDPITGNLWIQENGDDSFDELNLITAGQNGGWVQIMGLVERVTEFKEIETTFGSQTLQQNRWPPTNIADSPEEALSRLFILPGSSYSDPEFSWKMAVAPGAIGFVNGKGLGPQFKGDLFVGAATTTLEGGYLFHFNLTGNRQKISVSDPRLKDRVADNAAKFDITESETLLIGKDFGIASDIETGPNGNLFVVSLSQGAVYEIYKP